MVPLSTTFISFQHLYVSLSEIQIKREDEIAKNPLSKVKKIPSSTVKSVLRGHLNREMGLLGSRKDGSLRPLSKADLISSLNKHEESDLNNIGTLLNIISVYCGRYYTTVVLSTFNMELNDLRIIICLRKSEISVEITSSCNDIERLAELGIHCLPCS